MVRIFAEYKIKINKMKISVFFCITEKNIGYLNKYATLRPSTINHRNMRKKEIRLGKCPSW